MNIIIFYFNANQNDDIHVTYSTVEINESDAVK